MDTFRIEVMWGGRVFAYYMEAYAALDVQEVAESLYPGAEIEVTLSFSE